MSVLLMVKMAGPVVLKHAVPALMAKAVGTLPYHHVVYFVIYFAIVGVTYFVTQFNYGDVLRN